MSVFSQFDCDFEGGRAYPSWQEVSFQLTSPFWNSSHERHPNYRMQPHTLIQTCRQIRQMVSHLPQFRWVAQLPLLPCVVNLLLHSFLAVLADDKVDECADGYGGSFDASTIVGHTHTGHPGIGQNSLLCLQLQEFSCNISWWALFGDTLLLFCCITGFQLCDWKLLFDVRLKICILGYFCSYCKWILWSRRISSEEQAKSPNLG
jgi:hypothetical protein